MNVNSYNLLSPSLAIASPSPITNAFIGGTSTRTITVTNGGNGCLDTLRYYVVYSSGGIVNTSAGNAITANGIGFTPSSSHGDTLFYKIYGSTIFGGDSLLCNGETVTINENIKIAKCNAQTYYNVGWGSSQSTQCQSTTGSGTVTMATGAANISATFTRVQQLNWCQKGIFTISYTNNGNGGNAGAAYNLLANIGYNSTGNATAPMGNYAGNQGRIDSIKIGSVTVPLIAATATISAGANFSGLTADPDGAGTGLDDLDGDGQFDDLAPGKTVTITVYEHWVPLASTCPTPAYGFFTGQTLSYNSMCGTAYITNPLPASGSYRVQTNGGGTLTVPAEITGNTPFTVQACINLSSLSGAYAPVDSLYFNVVLPTGVSLSPTPNVTYSGTAVTAGSGYYVDTVSSVRTLHIRRKSKSTNFCYTADLIYDCSGGSTVSPQFSIYYQGDTCSGSIEKYMCQTPSIKADCPSPCPDGISNYLPSAKRLVLGYTDSTLTTKVAASAVTGMAAYSAIPLDTIQIIVPGKQYAVLGSYQNLYYNLQFGRIASTDVFQFVSGTFNQISSVTGTTSSVISAPTTTGSTTALQKLHWNLSGNLASGIINSGDSAWLDLRFIVTRANADALYGTTLTQVPNTSSTLYNINAANQAVGCDTAHMINMLVSGQSVGNYMPAVLVTNCNSTTTSSNFYEGNNTGLDIFPNEYRPQSIIDSVVISLPSGYTLAAPASNGYYYKYWPSVVSYSTVYGANKGIYIQRSSTNWVIQNPYLSSNGWTLSDLGNRGTSSYGLNYLISPTCASVSGTQPYTAVWYYRDYVYTGNASNYVSKTFSVSSTITYNATVTPTLTVQNNTGTVQGVLPQQYWDVQISSTGTGTAPYIWMSLEKSTGSGGISIDSVVLKPSNTVLTPLSFNSTDKWYQVSTAGLASGSSQLARVYFKYTSCSTDSILMRSGWNCTGYPSPDPLTGYACSAAQQYLNVIPANSQVQISMGVQPGNGGSINLCTQDSVTVIVNSAQSANLVNPYIIVKPPTGITLNGTIPVEYPLGSGNWQNIVPVAVTGGYQINLSNHSAIGSNGLPGTITNPSAAGRQATIKFVYSAGCSVVSGSQLDFYAYGMTPCNSSATGNGSDVKSNPINITGISAVGNAAVTASMSGSSSFVCGTTQTVNMSVIEVGTSTQTGDTAVYTLPAGLQYAGNFTGCSTCAVSTQSGTANTTLVQVALPAGVSSGTTISFGFDVNTSTSGNCGTLQITGEVERNVGGLSCGAVTCNVSKAVIGTVPPISVINNKPTIHISAASLVSGYWVPGKTATLQVTYQNTGTANAAANTYIAEFFCATSASTPFATYTFTQPLAVGYAATELITMALPSTTCAMGDLVTIKVQSVTNAGAVQCICSPSSYPMLEILPVELDKFSATIAGCKAIVNWQTEDEENIGYYELQFSANGSDYSQTAIVMANNNSGINKYSYTVNQPTTMGYYRLKIVDNTGKYAFSNLIMTHTQCNNRTLAIYPNPTRDWFRLSGLQSGDMIKVYSATGQLINEKTASRDTEQIDLSNYAQGVYSVVVISNNALPFTSKVQKID